MTGLKTKRQNSGVSDFLAGIADEVVRRECNTLADIMGEISGDAGDLWGTSIVGFGSYHYKYDSGRQADWFKIGFSPRKQTLTIYLMSGYDDKKDLLAKLGPHALGKSCLYLKRLSDIDLDVLEKLLRKAYRSKSYGEA